MHTFIENLLFAGFISLTDYSSQNYRATLIYLALWVTEDN